MKRIYTFLIAAICILTSCSHDETIDNAIFSSKTVKASLEQSSPVTRAALTETNDGLSIKWTVGDSFVMFVGDENTPAVYTLVSADNTNGTFATTSEAEGDIKGAAYPYTNDDDISFSDNKLKITLPSVIGYDPEVPTKCNVPMWGTADNSGGISFKHLASLLRIDCSNLPQGYNKLTVTASAPISGKFDVKTNIEDCILLKGENSTEDSDKSLTVNFQDIENADDSERAFYIPIPSGTYTSLSVTISDGTNERMVRCWTNITFKRAYYYTANVDCQYISADNAAAVNSRLGDIITDENTTAQIVIESDNLDVANPFVTPDVTNSNVTMVFPQGITTTETQPLKIESANKSDAAGESDRVLSIDVPASDGEDGAYVEVETPTTTVNITGGKFKTITAKTATNTLIVGYGVEIETLVIKAGNVRIQNGGSVSTLTYEGEEEILLVIENGATKPAVINDQNNKVKVLTSAEYDLMNTPDGTVYNLTQDMELTEPLYITGDVTVELNGYRITHKPGTWSDPNNDRSLVVIRRGGKFTVNNRYGDGRISVLNVREGWMNNNIAIHSCIKMTGYGESETGEPATLILNNGYIEGNYYCITGNGNRHDTYIEINGGWISSLGGDFHQDVGSETLGIYHPQNGTIKINGGTIKGYESAIEMRGGELIAKDAWFQVEPVTEGFNIRETSNGNTLIGTAIGISPHNGRAVKATINNCRLIGTRAFHEEYLYDGEVPEISVQLNSCAFEGDIFSENIKDMITEGTFYEPSGFDYLADNAKVYLADTMQLAKAITVENAITIDLCGHCIENKTAGHPSNITPQYDDECVVFMVTGNGNLTIEGEGTVKATGDGVNTDYNVAVWVMGENAKAVIKGGSYSNEKDTDDDGCDLIYARDGGKIEIHGGEFQSYVRSTLGGGIHDVLDCKDKTNSIITVYGGKFLNYAPSYENIGSGEVVLATGKKVYDDSSAEVTTAHDHKSTTDVWYEVR